MAACKWGRQAATVSATKALLHHLSAEGDVGQNVPSEGQHLENEADDNRGDSAVAAQAVALDGGENDGQYEEKKVSG